ncbi:MAG: nucleotidyl cyclase domain-containing protein [Terriglobales bacterium]
MMGPLLALLCLLLLDRLRSSTELLLIAVPGFYVAVGLAGYWGGLFSGLLTALMVMGYLGWNWDSYQKVPHMPWIALVIGGSSIASAWIAAPPVERRAGLPRGRRPAAAFRPSDVSEPLPEETLRELVGLEWHRWQRYKAPFSLVWLEVCDLGKTEASRSSARAVLLTQVVQGLIRILRNTDLIGQGDAGRFLLLLPHTDYRGGLPVALKLRNLLHSLSSPGGGRLTAYISTTSVHADDPEVHSILERGEKALESARLQGPDSIVSSESPPLSVLPPSL